MCNNVDSFLHPRLKQRQVAFYRVRMHINCISLGEVRQYVREEKNKISVL
jgi:hypothetical protein